MECISIFKYGLFWCMDCVEKRIVNSAWRNGQLDSPDENAAAWWWRWWWGWFDDYDNYILCLLSWVMILWSYWQRFFSIKEPCIFDASKKTPWVLSCQVLGFEFQSDWTPANSQETDLRPWKFVEMKKHSVTARVLKKRFQELKLRDLELSFQRAAGSLNALSWLLSCFFRSDGTSRLLRLLIFSSGHANISAPLGLWARDGGFCAENQFEGAEWLLVKPCANTDLTTNFWRGWCLLMEPGAALTIEATGLIIQNFSEESWYYVWRNCHPGYFLRTGFAVDLQGVFFF